MVNRNLKWQGFVALLLFCVAHVLADDGHVQSSYESYWNATQGPCCVIDLVVIIDRAYFATLNDTNNNETMAALMQLRDSFFGNNQTANVTQCMDMRVAVVEYGSNATVTYWLNNATTSEDALAILRNYTLGPYLGPDHNATEAYRLVNEEVLIPQNGLRMNATAATVLFTGADPDGDLADLMTVVNVTKVLAHSVVVGLGNNYTNETLMEIADTPASFFNLNNLTATNQTQAIAASICPGAFRTPTCCKSDVVFLLDRTFFGQMNETNRTEILSAFFYSSNMLCPDLRVAIVEYGSNASVIMYLNNFTSTDNMTTFLANYTLGPDLGPEHNVHLAYPIIREQVFNETNGRRNDANAVVVLITGSDPTDQSAAESEARRTEQQVPALLIVEAIGQNYTVANLQALSTSPSQDFFMVNSTDDGDLYNTTTYIWYDICESRNITQQPNVTCCPVNLVYMIDRAYFETLNSSQQSMVLNERLFNDSFLRCPEVQVAIIEFGSNYSIIRNFTNTTAGDMGSNNVTSVYDFLSNYTLGPDLGPEHREELVYPVVRDMLNATGNTSSQAVVILVTGADPTNQTAAYQEYLLTRDYAVMKVVGVGSNFTEGNLMELASPPRDVNYVAMPLDDQNATMSNKTSWNSSLVYANICTPLVPEQMAPTNCCRSDLVFLIDRAYFSNASNETELLQQMFRSHRLACPDIQVAIVEYGSNASVIIYFNNFTNQAGNISNMTSANNMTLSEFLSNYTVGYDAGDVHDAASAYALVASEILLPENGRRADVTPFVILVTGADPTNVTQALEQAMALQRNGTVLVVEAFGQNYNRSTLQQFANGPQYFFETANMTMNMTNGNNATNATMYFEDLFNAVCAANVSMPRPPPAGCPCLSDLIFLVDQAYFMNQTNQTELLRQLFNSSQLGCEEVHAAIVEFGSNATVVIYLNQYRNWYGPLDMVSNQTNTVQLYQYLQNYTVGQVGDLGTEHNAHLAYNLTGSDVLLPANGRRPNVKTYVILLTGADPTDPALAASNAMALEANGTVLVVDVFGENFTSSIFEQLVSSPQYFFQAGNASNMTSSNMTGNATNPFDDLFTAVCAAEEEEAPLPAEECCGSDLVFLLDRAYFGQQNETNGNATAFLQQLFQDPSLACSNVQVAIVEFGSNASIIIYLNNFTNNANNSGMSGANMTLAQYLSNYTLGPDLGPDHFVDQAYNLTGTEILVPGNGRRDNVTAYVILVTGADPTDQSLAMAAAMALMQNATLVVQALGNNFTYENLSALASSPNYFFNQTMDNATESSNMTQSLFSAVCQAPSNITMSVTTTTAMTPKNSDDSNCADADIVFLIDQPYFSQNSTSTNATQNGNNTVVTPMEFLRMLFNETTYGCPGVHVAIVEFGANASVMLYLSNFTNTTSATTTMATSRQLEDGSSDALNQYLINYSLGPDLGPGFNVEQAFALANDPALAPCCGRRPDVPAFVILVTGSSPEDATAAESASTEVQDNNNATVIVIALGPNATNETLRPLATSEQTYFFTFLGAFPDAMGTIDQVSQVLTSGANVTGENVTTTTPMMETTTAFGQENVTNTTTMAMTTTPLTNVTTNETTTMTSSTMSTSPSEDNVTRIDATAFCFSCQNRANTRSLFANPDDCYSFYQCFFHGPNQATGILLDCPPGTYFHEDMLKCLPEGPTPCQDQCQDSTLQCYGAPDNCATFFTCANGASYGQCCPPETRFNPDLCACEDDQYCADSCTYASADANTTASTTTPRAPTVNGSVCTDSFGGQYQAVEGRPDLFQQIDASAPRRRPRITTLSCPLGTSFVLQQCACTLNAAGTGVVAPTSSNQCLLYLPFDDTYNDASVYKFSTFPFGNVAINTGSPAQGTGSLFVDGGRLEIPGLEAVDFRQTGSWCFFFRCESADGCNVDGGILSNNRDASASQFSIIMAALANNSVAARLSFRNPANQQVNLASGALPSEGAVTMSTSEAGMTTAESSTSSSSSVTSAGTTTASQTETTTSSSTTSSGTTSGSTTESSTLSTTSMMAMENVTTSAMENMTTTAGGENTTMAAGNETTLAGSTFGPVLGASPMTTATSTGTWQHVCLVMTQTTTTLYLNGSPVQTSSNAGSLTISQCPYVIGNDQALGDFFGSIDEVLICESPLTQNDVIAHLNGDRAALASRGFLPTTQ